MSRLSYVILFTPQMDRMRQFYRYGLGLPVREDGAEWATFGTEGATLALHAMPDLGRKGIQVRFEEPDIEGRVRQLESRGVRIEGGIQSLARGQVASFWDPEGCLISLHQPGQPEEEPGGSDRQLSVVIINAQDLRGTRAFYRDVVGFQATIDSPWWVQFDTGPAALALHPRVERPEREAHHAGPITVGFATEDFHAWVEEMQARGILTSGPKDEGFGLRAEATDPDGNALAFSEAAARSSLEDELAEEFEEDLAPARAPIRKPFKKGSKAVSRIVVGLGNTTAKPTRRTAGKKPRVRATKGVASARGGGPAGSRVKPKRTADPKRARAKPAIGRLKKAERRTIARQKQAVAGASKGKPVKRAAARMGRR
ncbi:MAG TPA: VOC family protein [Candidatus Eisenbacteria bacterium]|jgi:predicted enzyme related to lactoylglutathione lyase